MILHCVHSDAEFLVVSRQDTDVFFLLVSHLHKVSCKQLWIRAGTSKKPKYLPIHTVSERLKETIPEVEAILSFHAKTGWHAIPSPTLLAIARKHRGRRSQNTTCC